MGPKYEFTDETMNFRGRLLYRIRRLSDGALGGWIQKEENLSQEGNCWVDDEAIVYINARVRDNAQVYGHAVVCDDAQVYGNARVYDDAGVSYSAEVYGNAKVYDNAQICSNAKVYGNASVGDRAEVSGNTKVYGDAGVWGNAWVYNFAKIYDNAYIWDDAQIYENAEVYGDAKVYGKAQVYGKAEVYDNAKVYDDACVYGDAVVCDDACVYGDAVVCDDDCVNEDTEVCDKIIDEDNNNEQSTAVVQDFIYSIDDSDKLNVKTEYNSIDEYFSSTYQNDIKLDTLIIGTVDTKISLIKIEKVEIESKTEFKFIVDITNEKGSNFSFKSVIKDAKQLNSLVTQTIEALNAYPEFAKYTNDLADCL